jgi:hypothetical protein
LANGLRLGVGARIVGLKRGWTGQSTSDEHRTRSRFRVFHPKVRTGCVDRDRTRDERAIDGQTGHRNVGNV